MPEFIIEAYGVDAIRETLAAAARRMTDMTPLLRAIGDRVVEQTKRRFAAGGPAPSGIPWAKPRTPNPKRVRTLTVSGHLRDSIRYQLRGRDAVAIGTNKEYAASRDAVANGTNKEYAAIHQLGGTSTQGARSELFVRNRYKRGAKKGQFKKGTKAGQGFTFGERKINIPARPFLGLSAGDAAELTKIVNDYLRNGR